jgi:protoporphyrinogen/coproporphyrinogen III oxidase
MNESQYDTIVVGGGLSGLSTAHFIRKFKPGAKILILEKQSSTGGAIQTVQSDGFLAEWGPHGFLDNVEESRELLADLGLTGTALKAPLRQFLRYICLNGELKAIPQTPPKIVTSNLLSIPSKIRLLFDLWKKPRLHEQSIADWASFRFGKAALPFADIILTGSYAGDIRKLSIDAAMPSLRRLELESGSVIRGAIKSQKANQGSGMPSMVSFEGGMTCLIEQLEKDQTIVNNAEVQSISRQEDGWQIHTTQDSYSAKQVVVASHINQALQLLTPLDQPPVDSVPEARIHNVVLGFEADTEIPTAFGFLVPREENRFVLGTLFTSRMFPQRAPKGMQILEVLIGGTRNPDRLDLTDDELIAQSCKDLKELLPLKQAPVFQKVLRAQTGIPQLEIGHNRFQAYKDRLQSNYQGLYVCGFGWEGIGVNEMIKDARFTAQSLVAGQPGTRKRAEIKGVYV